MGKKEDGGMKNRNEEGSAENTERMRGEDGEEYRKRS